MIDNNSFKNKKTNKRYEILYMTHNSLIDSGFSSKIIYSLYKQKYNRFFIFATNTKTFNLKIKQLKSNFKVKNNLNLFVGFYHAL